MPFSVFKNDCIFFRVDIEVVVREEVGGKMLSASEAIDLINQDKVKGNLKSENYRVSKVAKGELN